MQVIILSGGSGKRLWPLSNEVRSKQFIRLFQNEDSGEYESMVQRIYRQLKSANPKAEITIATSSTQVSAIKNQLGDKVSICVEPSRKDTFPAIALATLYLKDIKKINKDEAVVVCPVDPYVDLSYFENLCTLASMVEEKQCNIALMGMVPTYPSEKYGYIIPENTKGISKVNCFKEKPTQDIAKSYIEKGALWNGGVFSFTLDYLSKITEKLLGYNSYKSLYRHYDKVKKISFDYAVVENESEIEVLRYDNQWKDIGTWNTLAEVMPSKTFGNVVVDESCNNTNVINTLNIPVLCMGTNNLIITASNDGILVSDRHQSSFIKSHVEKFDQQIMFAEKSWGSFTVLDVQPNSMTIKIQLTKGNKLRYHIHEHRDESWNIISGEGTVIIDDIAQDVKSGDIINLPHGMIHTVIAKTELSIIEVQTGIIDANDKIVKSLDLENVFLYLDNSISK